MDEKQEHEHTANSAELTLDGKAQCRVMLTTLPQGEYVVDISRHQSAHGDTWTVRFEGTEVYRGT